MTIASFRHKGLKAFARSGDKRGIVAAHAGRLRRLLQMLDSAESPADISGRDLHPLAGVRSGTRWAMSVSGSWRLTFDFERSKSKGCVVDLDYLNYH